tara:strand:+ start:73 stop:531 length:459 start_codon:yes stop_codon:yes gene_type:complete
MKPLKTTTLKDIQATTKSFLESALALEDVLAKVQKDENVIKPNDSNWVYLMNNITVALHQRFYERTDWHLEQRTKWKRSAEQVVDESGSSSHPAEMSQKNRVLHQGYHEMFKLLEEFCKEHGFWTEWPEKDNKNVSKVQPKHIKEYQESLGL